MQLHQLKLIKFKHKFNWIIINYIKINEYVY